EGVGVVLHVDSCWGVLCRHVTSALANGWRLKYISAFLNLNGRMQKGFLFPSSRNKFLYFCIRMAAIDTELTALRNDERRSEADLRELIRDEVQALSENDD